LLKHRKPNGIALITALILTAAASLQIDSFALNYPANHAAQTVTPGVHYEHLIRNTGHGTIHINLLEIDPSNPEIEIEPALASTRIHGKVKVAEIVNQQGGIAGINAAFFKPDTGTALGTLILNKELIAGPIFNRVSLGITPDKKFKMARIVMKGQLLVNQDLTLPIHNINQPRLNKDEYILYSSRWGSMAPPTPKNAGMAIQINNGMITEIANRRLAIPADGYVLVGPDSPQVDRLKRNDITSIKVYTLPDWSDVTQAISGGPYLVKDGRVYVDAREEYFRSSLTSKPEPRTAVGFTANNHLLMVTVDGRQKGSTGVSLFEMARLMRNLGAVEAMNFDGGSSTQMVVRGHLMNSPSVMGGASVASALVVRKIPSRLPREVIGAESHGSTDVKF
jgi:exopolysaccharide biosynthesis protein